MVDWDYPVLCDQNGEQAHLIVTGLNPKGARCHCGFKPVISKRIKRFKSRDVELSCSVCATEFAKWGKFWTQQHEEEEE